MKRSNKTKFEERLSFKKPHVPRRVRKAVSKEVRLQNKAAANIEVEGSANGYAIRVSDTKNKRTMKILNDLIASANEAQIKEIGALAQQLGISDGIASDIIYLRSRRRWTQALEDQIIAAAKAGKPIDSNDIMTGEWPYGEREKRAKQIHAELQKLIKKKGWQ